MNLRLTARLTLFICTLLLAGCAHLQSLPDILKIPVPVPCNIKVVEKPYFPFTDANVGEMPAGTSGDVFTWTKLMLAEIQLRVGYESQLEASVKACNDKGADNGAANSKNR